MTDPSESITLMHELMWSAQMDQTVADALSDIKRRKGCVEDWDRDEEDSINAMLSAENDYLNSQADL